MPASDVCGGCGNYWQYCICKSIAAHIYNRFQLPVLVPKYFESKPKEKIMSNKTIRELQTNFPWTTHYHHDFRASPMPHKDFGHALLHVQKAIGKLAAVINDAEHEGSEFTKEEVDPYIADLVVCALRLANTCPGRTIDLEQAVIERIESKNGVKL